MKELEKVKRISIGSTLFILAIVIGVLAYERPENLYTMNAEETLENLTGTRYILPMENVDRSEILLVDVRSPYEFEKGHLENAVNIPTPEVLEEKNQALFTKWKESGKEVVLYGRDIEQANIPFLFLYQLGYENLKLLNAENSFSQNKMVTQPSAIERPVANVRAFIDESIENSKKVKVVEKKKVFVPKKVVPIKKKKKRPVEGGC